jgi:tryptophan-rich sensory protein
MRPALMLIGFLLASFAAAAIGNVFTADGVRDWYPTLAKPTWTPPGWLFGPVWTVLYICIGVAGWLVWRRAGFAGARVAMIVFGVQLALNALWSVLFFGMRQPGWAFVEIVLLWIAIAGTIIAFWRHSRPASLLLAPYLLWVTFASALNFAIWQLNR